MIIEKLSDLLKSIQRKIYLPSNLPPSDTADKSETKDNTDIGAKELRKENLQYKRIPKELSKRLGTADRIALKVEAEVQSLYNETQKQE